MPGDSLIAKLERSRSRGENGHSRRSESETRPITETRLSSFDSLAGEQVLTRGGGVGGASMREWAMLVEPASEGVVAMSSEAAKKKVMVVIDGSRESRLAMLWALSHIVHQADSLSLIHFIPSPHKCSGFYRTPSGLLSSRRDSQDGRDCNLKSASEKVDLRPSQLGLSLKTLCTSRRPEVEVEVMTVEGIDKGVTIVSQAKKLETSVLVLGQRKPSLLQRCRCSLSDAYSDKSSLLLFDGQGWIIMDSDLAAGMFAMCLLQLLFQIYLGSAALQNSNTICALLINWWAGVAGLIKFRVRPGLQKILTEDFCITWNLCKVSGRLKRRYLQYFEHQKLWSPSATYSHWHIFILGSIG